MDRRAQDATGPREGRRPPVTVVLRLSHRPFFSPRCGRGRTAKEVVRVHADPPTPSAAPANLEQQHKLAKDSIEAARTGDAAAVARIRAARLDAGEASRLLALADAQLAVAREAGFPSWPRLVADFQERDVKAFCGAVRARTSHARSSSSRWTTCARASTIRCSTSASAPRMSRRRTSSLLDVLIGVGADVNLRSDWQHGPYTVLDNADEATARWLLERGAALTPNVAARLGWLEDSERLVDADSALVHARGGDGQQPLHEAKTVEIADWLLDRGAGIYVRCIDHHSTLVQYALADRPDVCRRLLERGATPDIFMAARLGDAALATSLLDAIPSVPPPASTSPATRRYPPFNIYCWSLGFGLSPHAVATRFGHADVHALLASAARRASASWTPSSPRTSPRRKRWSPRTRRCCPR